MHEPSWPPNLKPVCRECGFIPRLHWSQFSPQQARQIGSKRATLWEEFDHGPGHTWSPNPNGSSRQSLFLQSAQLQTFSPKSYNLLSLSSLLPMQTKQASNLHLHTTKAFTIRATPTFLWNMQKLNVEIPRGSLHHCQAWSPYLAPNPSGHIQTAVVYK